MSGLVDGFRKRQLYSGRTNERMGVKANAMSLSHAASRGYEC